MNLENKTAIVTGASSGIGKAIAMHLAKEGANVVVAARRTELLDELVSSIKADYSAEAVAVKTDVSKKEDVKDLVTWTKEKFGAVDIYVNNAGVVGSGAVRDKEVSEWEKMIDVNIKGVLYGVQEVVEDMVDKGKGHIVNIASVAGLEVSKTSTVYSATKYAVRAISMGLEKELARTGVRVTNISPGMVETERNKEKLPADRISLATDDIANAVVYAVTQPDYVNVNEVTVRPV